jgi:predicted transcriptional regulator
MGAGDKRKLARKGDKEARTILLKATNRQIYMSVRDNPGIKESEIEMLTKNTSTNSEILRAIGRNREWTANRNVMKNLVMNSKTPVEVSNRFLSRMSAKDLEFVVKSRNLPMAVRNNAKRLIEQKKKGR